MAAEDVATDTLMKLYQHEKLKEIPTIAGWLFLTAKRNCLDIRQKEERERDLPDKVPQLFRSHHRPEALDKAMAEMRDWCVKKILNNVRDEEIWNLYCEGYHTDEIAEKMKMDEKTVGNRKSMARKKLQEKIKDCLCGNH